MRTTHRKCRANTTTALVTKFGSVIKLFEVPEYWPDYYMANRDREMGCITEMLWVLTSEYHRDEDRYSQIINVADGSAMGINSETEVEIIHERGHLMNIVKGSCLPTADLLDSIAPGACLRFASNLHLKHRAEDVFVRVNAISGYVPDSIKRQLSMPVVNLRTGELAYVSRRREVYPVEAELCVGDS